MLDLINVLPEVSFQDHLALFKDFYASHAIKVDLQLESGFKQMDFHLTVSLALLHCSLLYMIIQVIGCHRCNIMSIHNHKLTSIIYFVI
jgi:hypothetical protein